MEKSKERNENQSDQSKAANKSLVWDCGSTLYDSFELNSFKRQLDSAISSSSRSFSMPHLPDRRALPRPPPAPAKKSSKISRSLNKLLRSVFRPKPVFRVQEQSKDGFVLVYDKSGTLTTIPEVPEIDLGGFSPEIGSLVGMTGSERFAATSIGISCA
ncbi:hypothetical protein PanWU01x14_260850 [Parasponia andersonii]|uniref:Avr9/Cf-9 rapidly elicited protein n=1 Tax=Parasponia andersonii TaxID=3476 RepID=A0A2P5B8Z2_PARAD|nr:hypothetical protein PanWU01x14_260850 [Parasponia andersonii]